MALKHGQIQREIERLYRMHNGDLLPPWNGHHGTILKKMLGENPSWTLDRWHHCIYNRFLSQDVNVGEDPISWLKKLPNYCSGPLDRFGKLKPTTKSPLEEALAEQRARES